MKENNDTLYDIVFADEKRYQAQKIREQFDWQLWKIDKITATYCEAKLKNVSYKDWSSSASMVEILKETLPDLFVVKEIKEAIYQAFINAPTGDYYI